MYIDMQLLTHNLILIPFPFLYNVFLCELSLRLRTRKQHTRNIWLYIKYNFSSLLALLQSPFPPKEELGDTLTEDLLENEGAPASSDVVAGGGQYPFENLVLSGGGMRGYSYIGAIQVDRRDL